MPFSWKHVLPVAAALGFAALLAPAGAQQTIVSEDRIRVSFKNADQNGDGYINIDEYVAYYVLQFGALDKDRDGYLAKNELPASHDPVQYRAADRNGDGRLSLGEVVGDKVVEFFMVDVSRDGALTIEEVLIYERTGARK